MQEKLFIKKNGLTVGPFTAVEINIMLESGNLQSDDMASYDKCSWQYLHQLLNLPEPPDATLTRRIKASESVAFISPADAMPEPPDAPGTVQKKCVDVEPHNSTDIKTAHPVSWSRTFALSIAGAFNAAAALKELSSQSPRKAAVAGLFAMLASLIICVSAGAIFARYYETAAWIFMLRNVLFICFSAAGLYIFCSTVGRLRNREYTARHHATDYLAAMLALCSSAFVIGMFHAVMFYFNRNLFSPSPLQLKLLVGFFMLPVIFFSANGITALRLKFIAADELRSGTATLLAVAGAYIAAIIAAILFFPVYPTLN